MIAALIVLFIIINYLFIDSTFFKNKAGFSLQTIQLIFTALITMSFLRSNIGLVTSVVWASLIIIYVFKEIASACTN